MTSRALRPVGALADDAGMYRLTLNIDHIRLLRLTGFFAYLCTGMPLVSSWAVQRVGQLHQQDYALLLWTLSYLLFGVLYMLLTSNMGTRRHQSQFIRVIGLTLMTVCALAVGGYSHSGLSAILMVVASVVLPWLVPFWFSLAWLILWNVALTAMFSTFPEFNLVLALLQTTIYMGFAAMGFVASLVASQQADERDVQRRLNSELRATRALLAESTRIAERMRIARDLHDLIGHHLTALSLNLEVASHLANPEAAEHVRKAQATAKHLLSDVREAVSELRQDDAIDLTQALTSLIEGVPSLRVQLDTPPRFGVEDPRRAQVLLRCTQEIITNTARHAGARRLWLRFDYVNANLLELFARDDGRGAANFRPGNGLAGMRERLAEFGGSVMVDPSMGQGFALTVRMPLGEASELAHAPSRVEPPALGLL